MKDASKAASCTDYLSLVNDYFVTVPWIGRVFDAASNGASNEVELFHLFCVLRGGGALYSCAPLAAFRTRSPLSASFQLFNPAPLRWAPPRAPPPPPLARLTPLPLRAFTRPARSRSRSPTACSGCLTLQPTWNPPRACAKLGPDSAGSEPGSPRHMLSNAAFPMATSDMAALPVCPVRVPGQSVRRVENLLGNRLSLAGPDYCCHRGLSRAFRESETV
ncbi:hypothetical protein SKAU_G00273150 [Synaphobranchus kaupii]|uniref:Uncharacterized protein n=1 Tax=Synaphobranchus kaupii TaxID=118154 RepID=A0A9Q1F0R8_SYNKA|nr:hypothetical protein SKAU_G00273150 [Synaphobranchus kaupii]